MASREPGADERVMGMLVRLCVGLGIVLGCAAPAAATDVYLVARELPSSSASVRAWGFALDADGDLETIGNEVATAPGPRLHVTDGTLVVHLRNDLPVPIAIAIPALDGAAAPTAPGALGTYRFTDVRAGTFPYRGLTFSPR